MPDLTLHFNEIRNVDPSAYFTDADGDELTYRVNSSLSTTVFAVWLEEDAEGCNARHICLIALEYGEVKIDVTADDGRSGTATQAFGVAVGRNRPPEITAPMPDLSRLAATSIDIDLSNHFSDPDGGILFYRTASTDYATAFMRWDGETPFWIRQLGLLSVGTADITVTASDSLSASPNDYGTVTDTFRVTVVSPMPENAGPEVTAAIDDMTLAVGETQTIDLSNHFRDVDSDTLGYFTNFDLSDMAGENTQNAAVTVVTGDTDDTSHLLTITALRSGRETVTVTAFDIFRSQKKVNQTFNVTVR
jgi:hypothetical protein